MNGVSRQHNAAAGQHPDPAGKQTEQQAQVVRQFNRFYTVHLGLLRGRYLESDFSLSEGRIMYELSLNPASTANELRTKLNLDAGYMSRLVRSLTERGLVQGRRSETDKRRTMLRLTGAGQVVMADLNQRASAETMRMLDQLDGAHREELLAALSRVQQILSLAGAGSATMASTPATAATVATGTTPAAFSTTSPLTPTTITRATAADFTAARALLHAYFDAIDVVLRDDDAAIRAFLDAPDSAMWIAWVDGVPAGCVALRPLPATTTIDGAAECKRLYVDHRFRRRGVAEALMRALETHAAAIGYRAVYLDTKDDLDAAIALYQRIGYVACPRYNDNPQATMFMRKALPVTRRA